MEIRESQISDAMELARIQVQTWQFAYKDFMPKKFLDSMSISERTNKWKKILKENAETKNGRKTFIALEKDKALGFVSIGPSREEENAERGELFAIYVDVNTLRKGAGTALMKKALTELKKDGYKKAFLWVIDGNERAEKFYVKQGWMKTKETKVDERETFKIHEVKYRINL